MLHYLTSRGLNLTESKHERLCPELIMSALERKEGSRAPV